METKWEVPACLPACLNVIHFNSFIHSFIFPCDCIEKSPVISDCVLHSLYIQYLVFIESLFLSLSVFYLFVLYVRCLIASSTNVTSNFQQMENFMLHFKRGALELFFSFFFCSNVNGIAASLGENFMARSVFFSLLFSLQTWS